MKRPVDYKRRDGDGRRFQIFDDGGQWSVWGDDEKLCDCRSIELAEIVAEALERDADYDEAARIVDKVFGTQGE